MTLNYLALVFILSSPILAKDPTLLEQVRKSMARQDWPGSVALFQRMEASHPLTLNDTYNYACVLALAGQPAQAMEALQRVMDSGGFDPAHMRKDSDLVSLHNLPGWEPMLAKLEAEAVQRQHDYEAPALETVYKEQLTEAERIAGLARFWSEAKYNFANFDLVPELDWDAKFLEYLPKVQAAADTTEYYWVLQQFCSQLTDGHTNVYPPEEISDQFWARPAILTKLIEDRVLISELLDPSLASMGFQVGMEILAIDGEPVKAYAARKVAPYVSASTPQDRLLRIYGNQILAGDVSKPVTLTLADAKGGSLKLTVDRLTYEQRSSFAKPDFSWEMLPDGYAWVRLNSFGDNTCADEFLKLFPEISKAKGIIFDVRQNGGGSGSVGYAILSTLVKEDFVVAKWSSRRYVPVFRPWGRGQTSESGTSLLVADEAHQYDKPVIVLTSAATYSAAEDFAGAFKMAKRGLILGEASGGSTGQPLQLKLPGGITARICSKRDRMGDGTEFVGVGIQPDRVVLPTVAGIRAGRDEVLEAAIAQLKSTH